ncbi:hypothetical protein Dimus_027275 [Dionaea muscipula]
MKPRGHVRTKSQKSENNHGEGPNWVLIAGSALLSTISIHVGRKLKQAFEAKQPDHAPLKESGKFADQRRSGVGLQNSNVLSVEREEYGCSNCIAGMEGVPDVKNPRNGQIWGEPDVTLPVVAVSAPDYYHRGNGTVWASSPERLELPSKPLFHASNCSNSPSVSECGSDIFGKREVIQKLRQQLNRRDDMILEMQDQLVEFQNALSAQVSHSNHLQAQLDATNMELLNSEREIQKLRKTIADHCIEHAKANIRHSSVADSKGHANGHLLDGESTGLVIPERGGSEKERIEMLRSEIQGLKEVIQGKEYLVQSYKEQKIELSLKIKELQQRLDSQLPNIL